MIHARPRGGGQGGRGFRTDDRRRSRSPACACRVRGGTLCWRFAMASRTGPKAAPQAAGGSAKPRATAAGGGAHAAERGRKATPWRHARPRRSQRGDALGARARRARAANRANLRKRLQVGAAPRLSETGVQIAPAQAAPASSVRGGAAAAAARDGRGPAGGGREDRLGARGHPRAPEVGAEVAAARRCARWPIDGRRRAACRAPMAANVSPAPVGVPRVGGRRGRRGRGGRESDDGYRQEHRMDEVRWESLRRPPRRPPWPRRPAPAAVAAAAAPAPWAEAIGRLRAGGAPPIAGRGDARRGGGAPAAMPVRRDVASLVFRIDTSRSGEPPTPSCARCAKDGAPDGRRRPPRAFRSSDVDGDGAARAPTCDVAARRRGALGLGRRRAREGRG